MLAMKRDPGDSNKPRGATTGIPDEPAVGLAGWKPPRLKLVILKERPPLPRMKDLNWRSPLCGPLPASFSHDPTPHKRFVENKSQTSIRPTGDRAVEALFSRFQGSNRGQFWPCFLVPGVRSAEGRNPLKPRGATIAAPQTVILKERPPLPRMKDPIWRSPPSLADCRVLMAER